MAAKIDYYFTSASPFTYLGHAALVETAARHGATIVYMPVNLTGLWEISGAVPPGQRPPVRQRYRFIELQRIAERRQLPIILQPKHFPVDPTLADHCTISIAEDGGNPASFMQSVFSGVWANDEDIADERVIRRLLEVAGHDADEMLGKAKGEEAAAIRAENTRQAIKADAVGVPVYVLNGEPFWGQDRIEYLDRALETGRNAYAAP